MYKNIIFDLGNVFFYWNPNIFFVDDSLSEKDKKIIRDVVFPEWHLMDDGYTKEEFLKYMEGKLPKHLEYFPEFMFDNWPTILAKRQFEQMYEIRAMLKKNHKVFILSNIPCNVVDYQELLRVNENTDGCVFSGVERLHKPQKEIFELILNRYNLKASETLFIDDMAKNIAGAESVGIKGYLYDYNKFDEFVNYLKENNDL